MFSATILTTLFAAIALVRADPDPSEPGPGSVYNEGSKCHISWDPDTTGTWTTMNIELMTGSNTGMVHLTTVATVDGTNAANVTFDYDCPEVTPNSAIYFYQFTSPASSSVLWTTRFAIADSTGKTTDPTNATQPGGDAIPWGTGALVDPSTAVAAPSKGTAVTSSSNSTSVGSSAASGTSQSAAGAAVAASSSAASGSASSPSSAVSGSAAAHAAVISTVASSSTGSSAASTPSTTGAAAANGAVGALAVSSRLVQAAATLGLVAFGYAVAL